MQHYVHYAHIYTPARDALTTTKSVFREAMNHVAYQSLFHLRVNYQRLFIER
jgi:hypothetical protein